MASEFPRGSLGPFPVPQVSVPGYSFGGQPPYGYGIGFPGLFGIGSGGIELGPLTIPFGGPSAKDVTGAAIARLRGTGNPALRRLGSQIAASGLYTSSATAQPQLGSYVHEAVQGLEGQGFPRTRAFNIVSNIISNKPTGPIRAPISQPGMFARRSGASEFVGGFLQGHPLIGKEVGAAIGGAVGLPFEEPVFGAAVGELAGGIAQHNLERLFPPPSMQPSIPSVGNMTSPMSQPGQFPIAPTLKPCPECGYNPPLEAQFQQPTQTFPQSQGGSQQGTQDLQLRAQQAQGGSQQGTQDQLQELRAQQQQLQQEIQTEQSQGRQQQINQVQQQLDQLRQLENQPVETRNVQQELQQKQQLSQQIQQLLSQPGVVPGGQQAGGGPTPGQVPTLHYQSPPPLPPYEAETAPAQQLPVTQPQQIRPAQQLPVTQQPGGAPAFVKFCVFCTTQNESLKFLNGEPSECSISPE
jgi:hypothetical protein